MYTICRNGQGTHGGNMSRVIRSLLDPCIYIRVDWDKEKVIEAAYRCSGKPFELVERNDEQFENILYKALSALSIKSVLELKEIARSDEKLKVAFNKLYKRKLKIAQVYKIEDDT